MVYFLLFFEMCIIFVFIGNIFFVFLGGLDRVCFFGDERFFVKGTMRAIGDWVFVKDSCIWFCGRNDR